MSSQEPSNNKCDSSCYPFNQYNTDYVKLDANNFHEVDGGLRMARNGDNDDDTSDQGQSQFALLISSSDNNSSGGSHCDDVGPARSIVNKRRLAKRAILSAIEPDSISVRLLFSFIN